MLEDQEALPGNAFGILMRGSIHMCRHAAAKWSRSQMGKDFTSPKRLEQLQRSGPVNLEARKRSLKQELKSNAGSLSATWLSLGRDAYVL